MCFNEMMLNGGGIIFTLKIDSIDLVFSKLSILTTINVYILSPFLTRPLHYNLVVDIAINHALQQIRGVV